MAEWTSLTSIQSKRAEVAVINATKLPTKEMRDQAARTRCDQAEQSIRLAFEKEVSRLPKLKLVNTIDNETPSLDFKFIRDYISGKEVYRADPDSFEGCAAPCKPNMGNHIGCEWPRECKCLEYAAVNEDNLKKQDPKLFTQYQEAKEIGENIHMRRKSLFPILVVNLLT